MINHSPVISSPLMAAGICYADMDPRRWRANLQEIASAGFNWVDVVVPWRTHAPASGQFDFSSGLDLQEFLNVVAASGLRANLRLGPCVALSRPQFGLPDHVSENPAMQARTHHGSPMWVPSPSRLVAVPSYDSVAFVDAVARWVAEVANHSQCPAVEAITFDVGDHWFFRDACVDGDFHNDSCALFQRQSQLSKEDIVAKNASYDHREHWLRWKRSRAQRFASSMTQRTQELWPGVVRYAAVNASSSMQQRRAVGSAICGGVMLQSFLQNPATDLPQLSFVDDCCPTITEVLASRSAWLPPTVTTKLAQQAHAAISAGASGVAFTGWIPAEHEVAVNRTGVTSFVSSRQSVAAKPEMALVVQCESPKTGTIDPVPPTLLGILGLDLVAMQSPAEQDETMRYQHWISVVVRALKSADICFDIIDDSATVNDCRKYNVVISPSMSAIRLSFAKVLSELAAQRTTSIVLGPRLPTLDEQGRPLPADALPTRIGRLREKSLEDVEGLSADLAGLRK